MVKEMQALVIGATSSLGQALCAELARGGASLVLSGRNKKMLEAMASDLTIRFGTENTVVLCDLARPKLTPRGFVSEVNKQAPKLTRIFLLAGEMGDAEDQDKEENIEAVTRINYTSPAKLLTALAADLSKKKGGEVAVISSVAGDRGRQSNYVYGSAKAALTSLASGLRNKYADKNVHVMTVKPGFIDTPMTYGMESPLIASRETVAKAIVKALEKKKNSIYVPFFWWGIMTIIKSIPEPIFKKLKL
jgi:short-subunit dehydrogenase